MSILRMFFLLCLVMLLLTGERVLAQKLSQAPVNLDFAQGNPGDVPPGWFVPPAVRSYTAQLARVSAVGGTRIVTLSLKPGAQPAQDEFGNMMQTIDATKFRGKNIRYRAAIRYESDMEEGEARMWIRADRVGGVLGLFDNMANSPITPGKRAYYEIMGRVDEDADQLNFGVMLIGKGTVFIDDVHLEIVGEVPVSKALPLSPQGLQNLTAFTRLLGYVRHFHPSDAAANADWNALAIQMLPDIEAAKDTPQLIERLQSAFHAVAPTVLVYPTGQKPALPPAITPPKEANDLQIVYWKHVGFGQSGAKTGYSSERVHVPSPGGGVPVGEPDPGKPFIAELSDGVSCLVPTTLYADHDGVLPHTVAPILIAPTTGGEDRTTRLADVALAWNAFQHFYPYFDVVKTDWKAVLHDSLISAATDTDSDAFLKTLERMVAALHDGHGNVFQSNVAYYMPLLRWRWIENHLAVLTVLPGGPPQLKPGDVVLKIQDRPAAEAIAEEEKLVSGSTPQWIRWSAVERLLNGAQGSALKLSVRRGGAAPFEITLTRSLALGDAFRQHLLEDKRSQNYSEIRPGIVYVNIAQIDSAELKTHLQQLAKAKGVVCDLRGYPTGGAIDLLPYLADKPFTSAHWNIPVYTLPDQAQVTYRRSRWPLTAPAEPHIKGKVAFLTDGRAISYADSYLGIVEAYKLAEIVGSPTAGTNGNINYFDLPGHYRLVFTGMQVIRHDDKPHQGHGIEPTIPSQPSLKGIAEGRDEVLEKALEVVSKP